VIDFVEKVPIDEVTGSEYNPRSIPPAVGRLVSRDSRAYSYLPESIAAVPQGADMCRLIEQSGWTNARALPLTFGVCTIYTATK